MIQILRKEFPLTILLDIAQLPRATSYYHLKQMQKTDKYASVKEEITAIYHENKGRYGYRRITEVLHSHGFAVNHKTVQRLMKEPGLICRVRRKKYSSYKGEVGKVAPNLILHSDQGRQYRHKQYQRMLRENGIRQSMSRKGNCLDNAVIENFFGLLKSELLYLQEFTSMEHFKPNIRTVTTIT